MRSVTSRAMAGPRGTSPRWQPSGSSMPSKRSSARSPPRHWQRSVRTQTHSCLRATELAGSRDDLTEWLGEAPTSLAYPFGVWGVDVDLEVAEAAEAAGYSAAVVNGTSPFATNPLISPRR